MRKEYYEIYKHLGDVYRKQSTINQDDVLESFSSSVNLVEQSIDTAISELKVENYLRPDARHFLVINFHQMIFLPLTNIHNEERYDIDNILNVIYEDSKAIIHTAKKISGDGKEISGSQILKAASFCYDKLYLSGGRLSEWIERLKSIVFWG